MTGRAWVMVVLGLAWAVFMGMALLMPVKAEDEVTVELVVRPVDLPDSQALADRQTPMAAGFMGVAFMGGQLMVQDAWGQRWAAPLFSGCRLVVAPVPTKGRMPILMASADRGPYAVPGVDDEVCEERYRRPKDKGTR